MEITAPGKKLLKVCGILFIILGAISAISSAGSVVILNTWESLDTLVLQTYEQMGITKSILTVSLILAMVQAVIYLVAGILGVKNSNRVEKANGCIIMASICIVFVLANAVYTMILSGLSVVNLIIGLVVPILYLWGALKNKQATAVE